MGEFGFGGFILGPECLNEGQRETPLAAVAKRPGAPGRSHSMSGCREGRSDGPKPKPGAPVEPVAQGTELYAQIVDVISKEGMVEADKIKPDATIESLDLKSIDIVMILTAIEEKFDVYIPMDGAFQEAKTVQDLVDALAGHIQKEKS